MKTTLQYQIISQLKNEKKQPCMKLQDFLLKLIRIDRMKIVRRDRRKKRIINIL